MIEQESLSSKATDCTYVELSHFNILTICIVNIKALFYQQSLCLVEVVVPSAMFSTPLCSMSITSVTSDDDVNNAGRDLA